MLPTPREFCRHILSERTTQAASNKRRLHPVSGGISMQQPVTYVTINYSEKKRIKFELQKGGIRLSKYLKC